MLNTYMSYNPPHLDQALVWLNLDPGLRDYTAGTSNVHNWKNALNVDEVYTQSNSNRRPTDTGSAYSFDGGDWLGSGAGHILDTSDGGWTVVIRILKDDWADNDAFVGDDSSNNSFIRNNTNIGVFLKGYSSSLSAISNKGLAWDSTLNNSQYYNLIITCDSSGENFAFVDGTKQAATPSWPNNTYDILMDEVGAKNGNAMQLEGDIQEVFIFNTHLTDTQCVDIDEYLKRKFIAV